MSLRSYFWVELLNGGPWQIQGIDLKQESRAWSQGPTMKQQQDNVHGMEIKLVQAKNAVEQPGKGKVFSVWFLPTSVFIQVTLGS
ncbi:hypothetical protein K492DRAFT_196932 [Lichtheimia hyalospora FSU 10163]|nr:hypothetical protein K492DRAFT_196932 [Lichtheimia hyalospora FSU 10163]